MLFRTQFWSVRSQPDQFCMSPVQSFFYFLGSPVQRFNRMKKKNMKFWKEKYIVGILKYWPGRQKKKTKKGIDIMWLGTTTHSPVSPTRICGDLLPCRISQYCEGRPKKKQWTVSDANILAPRIWWNCLPSYLVLTLLDSFYPSHSLTIKDSDPYHHLSFWRFIRTLTRP